MYTPISIIKIHVGSEINVEVSVCARLYTDYIFIVNCFFIEFLS